jgi:hypothetical protein
MANDYLVPNGSDAGWDDTTAIGDIDNGGLAPSSPGGGPTDSGYFAEDTDDTVLNLDLSATTITDADTVTAVAIYVRALTTGVGNDKINVDWIIGGTSQGSFTTANLSGSFADYTATNAGWNSDWTASELAGAQVRLTTNQTGKAETLGVQVSEVEVYITFTEGPGETNVTAITGEVEVVGQTPAVVSGVFVDAITGEVSAEGQTPTVTIFSADLATGTNIQYRGDVEEPGRGFITTPISVSDTAVSVTAITGEVSVEGQAPTVLPIYEPTVFPITGEVSVEGNAATVEAGFTATPSTGEVSVEGQAPTVAVIYEPTAVATTGEVSVEGQTPTVATVYEPTAFPITGEVSVEESALRGRPPPLRP